MPSDAESLQPHNPYGSKGMLQNIDMFFGRTDVLRRTYAEIRDKQSLSLVGSRRIGKSSLLNMLPSPELYQRSGYTLTRCLFVLIDLEEYIQETCEDFFDFTIRQLLAQGQGKISLTPPAEINADAFRDILDQVQDAGYHTVLLLDEFDSVTINPKFDFSFFSFLRAQANAGRVSYITASKEHLDKVCHSDIHGSPFFNIFSTCELGPLTKEEALALINQPAEAAGLPFTQQEADWILKRVGCHPFFIQRACYYLFEEKSISTEDIPLNLKRVARQIYLQLVPHFTYIWEHLNKTQQEQLRWEALRINVAQRLLPEFSAGLLFRSFVRNICEIDLTSITTDDLCTIMDKLDDLRFLGASKLAYLNLIYIRLREEERTNVFAKGAIVDELLQSAIEKMRPTHSLSEANSEWRAYNILNWYHKDKIHNDEVAARLGIGLRHFYRERRKAAHALLQVLIKMEMASKADMET